MYEEVDDSGRGERGMQKPWAFGTLSGYPARNTTSGVMLSLFELVGNLKKNIR